MEEIEESKIEEESELLTEDDFKSDNNDSKVETSPQHPADFSPEGG